MGLFDRLFGNRKKNNDNNSVLEQSVPVNENAVRLLECGDFIDEILKSNKYIARSEYITIEQYSEDIDFFDVLKKAECFRSFQHVTIS